MCGSLASQSSMSPKSTSMASPSDTSCEKPMPRPRAQSSMADATDPDCETKASVPAAAPVCAKLALRPACGASTPSAPGPTMRSRWLRAAVSMACSCASSRPALSTIAALVPARPSWSMRPGTAAGGVQTTASSGAAGRLATSGQQRAVPTLPCFGFTAYKAPA